MLHLLFLSFLGLLHKPVPALKAQSFNFIIINQAFSFSDSLNLLLEPKTWSADSPQSPEFIYFHVQNPQFIKKIIVLSPNKYLQIFTNTSLLCAKKQNSFSINSSPEHIFLIFRIPKPKPMDVYLKNSHIILEKFSPPLHIKQLIFTDKNNSPIPAFIIRPPLNYHLKKIVQLSSNTATATDIYHFFQLHWSEKSYFLILGYKKQNSVKGILFFLSPKIFRSKYVSFNIQKNKYFLQTPFGPILTQIPDSALVDPTQMDTLLLKDIKYATTDNFTHRKLYPCARCLLRYEVALNLIQAAHDLFSLGYKFILYDCYRPLYVQKIMWKVCPNPHFLVPPSIGSIHNRAAAIDVGLAYHTNQPVDMGTPFDSQSEKAHTNYPYLPPKVKYHRQLLHFILSLHKFHGIKNEWWHFYFIKRKKYHILSMPIPCNNQ